MVFGKALADDHPHPRILAKGVNINCDPRNLTFFGFGFFAKNVINHFLKFALGDGVRGLALRTGYFRFQIQNETLKPFTTGLELFYALLQFSDFLAQGGGNFLFIHGVGRYGW